jgi:beta-glucanase (GH16 family)
MKRKWLSIATVFAISFSMLAAAPAVKTKADSTGWNLVWSDEFNGTSLDTTNWSYDTGAGGWGNNELEDYTNRTQNVAVQNGNLVITAQPESYGGANYTSGRIKSEGIRQFTYGKIEARIKLPAGQGLWPAFWLLGSNITSVNWPECGEIDAMEHINNNANVAGSAHWYSNGEADYSNTSANLDFSQFHVYDVVWDTNNIRWYVDNQLYSTLNISSIPAFQNPFFIIMNLAVGGNWPGNPDGTTQFPAQMLVDYVRVYQGSGTTVATPTITPSTGTYTSAQSVSIADATSGSTIRYTTDGSAPSETNGTVYTGAFSVPSTTTVNAIAYDAGMTDSAVGSSVITIGSGGTTGTNLALNKTATASSVNGTNTASLAFDGNTGTRWESAYSDPQWISVDLGSNCTVSGAQLNWETAAAKAYSIQVSTDNTNWTTVYSESTGTGGVENISFSPVTARYVRMYGTARTTNYGYSLWEFQVLGTSTGSSGGTSTNLALNKTATASSVTGTNTASLAVDSDTTGTRWESAYSDPQWISVDLGANHSITGAKLSWETAAAKAYSIQVSTDNTNWTTVYSESTGTGGVENITFNATTARYVRMYGTARTTGYGYSLWDFEVFGS